jgi:hydroxymethylbilane synthase
MARLRIGSRGSQLALWQANHVAALLRDRGHQGELEIIKTTGDKITEVALAQVGTKGMFTKEIEEALAEKRVDLAVHSLKDVPTELEPRFVLAAIMERVDPRDVFVSHLHDSIAALPTGARVGTSSLRRQAQLKALRPDLDVHPLRGNVDTRLRKLAEGQYAAIILAAAGVTRLNLAENVRSSISVDVMCPAAGQGALAIETRTEDETTRGLLAFLEHAPTRTAILCERALLGAMGGGCQVPIGAYAEVREGDIRLRAVVARPDGSRVLRHTATGADPETLGREVATVLLGRGGDAILRDIYGKQVALPQQP